MTISAIFFVYTVVFSLPCTSSTLGTIDSNQVIRDGETLSSAGGIFELGFFSPPNVSTRYLGIWYKNITPQTIVWVANRKFPLSDASGALNLTGKGTLILLDGAKNVVWSSTGASGRGQDPVAQLLDSGNLLVWDRKEGGPDNYMWQSFDYPCDTLLAGMKLGTDFTTGIERYLSSWLSPKNPTPGPFSLCIDTHGYPQLVRKTGSVLVYRAGSWNGLTWSGTPYLLPSSSLSMDFVINEREAYFGINVASDSGLTRFTISSLGIIQMYTWNDRTHRWGIDVNYPPDPCESYAFCGAYAVCTINASESVALCSCFEGFVPKSPSEWNSSNRSKGCARKTPLDCSEDGFLKHPAVKLPDTSNSSWSNSSLTLSDCETLCLTNCSCTAYANLDIRGSGCLFWHGELIDTRQFIEGGQDIFVRLAASELGIGNRRSTDKKKQAVIIAGLVVSAAAVVLLLAGVCFSLYRKSIRNSALALKHTFKDEDIGGSNEEIEIPMLDPTTIAKATDKFSFGNKLGEGGFGPVYKGTLVDGQDIAVKRLSKYSGQGFDEFKTEVKLIAKLQHRNLVKLLGFCINKDEKMLIYEYMSNKSLNSFIFDKTKSRMLDWSKRFHVIQGIARGLLYLHQDSRLRIIHRDLKTSNILLDDNLNAKISDFGLARTFGADQTEANTKRVVGTYGYMAPEYAVDGLFSTKSDVFSFGVIIIEIVSGSRNRGFSHPNHDLNLLGHAWMLWKQGTPLELLDLCLVDACSCSQVARCINIALLCVQQNPEDRPTMSQAVVMPESDHFLSEPKQPGFFTGRNPPEATSSSSNVASCSENTMTETIVEGR